MTTPLPDPLGELMRKNAALYEEFVAENVRLEEAFLSRRPSAVAEALRKIGQQAKAELGIEESSHGQPAIGEPAASNGNSAGGQSAGAAAGNVEPADAPAVDGPGDGA